jgi:hypothetical protein
MSEPVLSTQNFSAALVAGFVLPHEALDADSWAAVHAFTERDASFSLYLAGSPHDAARHVVFGRTVLHGHTGGPSRTNGVQATDLKSNCDEALDAVRVGAASLPLADRTPALYLVASGALVGARMVVGTLVEGLDEADSAAHRGTRGAVQAEYTANGVTGKVLHEVAGRGSPPFVEVRLKASRSKGSVWVLAAYDGYFRGKR